MYYLLCEVSLGFLNYNPFKSKKKTTVATSIVRVIEDPSIPDAIIKGVSASLLQNGDMIDYVKEELVTSLGMKAHTMYKYAKNNYANGLPSTKFFKTDTGTSAIESVVRSIYSGQDVVMDYSKFGAANILHAAWQKMHEVYGYNKETNEIVSLTAAKGTPVYLVDLRIVVPAIETDEYNQDGIAQWGQPPKGGKTYTRELSSILNSRLASFTPVTLDPIAIDDYAIMDFEWQTSVTVGTVVTNTIHKESLIVPTTDLNQIDNYFMAHFYVDGVSTYWSYKLGAGTHPSLDDIYDVDDTPSGSFFPFIYYRLNKTATNINKESLEYKSSVKTVKKLGFNFEEVAEKINSNPDIADVEQAIMMFAVPAYTENLIEQEYLFNFFTMVHSNTANIPSSIPNSTRAAEGILARFFQNLPGTVGNAMVIKDKKFKMTLNNSGINIRNRVGRVNQLGKEREFSAEVFPSNTVRNFVNLDGTPSSEIFTGTTHIYKKQITPTIYREIQIKDLTMAYNVFEQYDTIAEGTENFLLIPLDMDITEEFSISDREELYARSLHFVFNSRVITKIKWYQTGIFKIFLYVVAIIITIYTAGGASAIFAAIAAMTATQLLIAAVVYLIKYLIVSLVFKLFVKVLGVKFAFVLAVAAAVLGIAGSQEGATGVTANFASELLMVGNGLISATGKRIQDDMQDLMNEASSYEKFMKEQTKLLDDANGLLNNSLRLDPMIIFGESPDDYYNRTVHSGNIGVVSIDMISTFVDVALTLPKSREIANNSDEPEGEI